MLGGNWGRERERDRELEREKVKGERRGEGDWREGRRGKRKWEIEMKVDGEKEHRGQEGKWTEQAHVEEEGREER